LWRFLKSRDSGVPLKVLVLAAVLYVILPTDLLPDVVPFAGWIDDVGIVALVTTFLAGAYEKRKAQRNASAPPGGTSNEAPRATR
jgi:uncharacterized membrane protein YkvA (DUF1232 family)